MPPKTKRPSGAPNPYTAEGRREIAVDDEARAGEKFLEDEHGEEHLQAAQDRYERWVGMTHD